MREPTQDSCKKHTSKRFRSLGKEKTRFQEQRSDQLRWSLIEHKSGAGKKGWKVFEARLEVLIDGKASVGCSSVIEK